jgi:hypothetical protein
MSAIGLLLTGTACSFELKFGFAGPLSAERWEKKYSTTPTAGGSNWCDFCQHFDEKLNPMLSGAIRKWCHSSLLLIDVNPMLTVESQHPAKWEESTTLAQQ